MYKLHSEFLLLSQPFQADFCGKYKEGFVSLLEHSGPKPPPWAEGANVVIMVEDRDKFASFSRGARFHPIALAEAFENAAAVLAVLYRRPGQRERLGHELHKREHVAAVEQTLAKDGTRIFIKTTNDRLTYWAQIARLLAPSDCEFRYTDSDGAAKISAEWGEVAA